MLFALHLVAFHTAFSTKTHGVLHHIRLRFAPKRIAFSGILHGV